MTISIGINDLGFAQILTALAANRTGPDALSEDGTDIAAAVYSGDWSNVLTEGDVLQLFDPDERRVAGLDELRRDGGLLDQLATGLGQLSPQHVYVMEYPNPTTHSVGGSTTMCNAILVDVGEQFGPDAKIDLDEQRLLVGWGTELNQALEVAANEHDWTYVKGLNALTRATGRGYCADDPPAYVAIDPRGRSLVDPEDLVAFIGRRTVRWPSRSGVRWLRRAGEAEAIQGPPLFIRYTSGTFHPNEMGHLAACEILAPYLEAPAFLDASSCELANTLVE